ncbi:MAG: PAS domain-containing methyl-accepting chemotaxis protein [Roseiarcus sp.]|jgi:methyl-accepting chemotaxis protein
MHPDFGGDAKRVLKAVGRSLAIIEFEPNGKIIAANENFCRLLGFELAEIKGKHHSLLVEPDATNGPDYKTFWAKLERGEFEDGEYKLIAKDGREVWIRAFYNPVVGASGKALKVVVIASDITAAKLLAAENAAKVEATSRAQCIIEYAIDGTILTANENLLNMMGYLLEKLQGQHHRMFVDATYAKSPEYQEFWRRLNRGERIEEEYKRVVKGGREAWIQASYNPIFDLSGRVYKVVNFMTDVTGRYSAVEQIGLGLSKLAEGDLEHRIETEFIPALEPLRVDFNASLGALEQSMLAVRDNTDAIRAGAGEISTAADDLSQRTEQQASSLEETAAALEEITATVKKTAEGAKHARDIVSTAKVDADKSGEVVREAMAAMTGIDKSSKQISEIIGVIDEIAFQTNLLALNAGVEAARAGDAGRGFAVVASEVRALAQRSAQAAKEIKGLISASTAQVDQGVRLVTKTGDALGRIVAQVVEINTVVTDIAASAQEQSTGLEQVNAAVNQMDQVTQKNAAMVGEMTAAAHGLAGESEELGQLVARYQIRRAKEDSLRAELKKAAPHAFREAKKTAAPQTPTQARAKPEPVRRPAVKAVVNGPAAQAAASGGASDDWQEF